MAESPSEARIVWQGDADTEQNSECSVKNLAPSPTATNQTVHDTTL